MKHKIFISGNYGPMGRPPKKCIKFLESKGKKWPDILKCRHDSALIEMFEKFAETLENGHKILYTDPIDGLGSYRGYFQVIEINCDTYCITDYDGAEGVSTYDDFNWVTIKN